MVAMMIAHLHTYNARMCMPVTHRRHVHMRMTLQCRQTTERLAAIATRMCHGRRISVHSRFHHYWLRLDLHKSMCIRCVDWFIITLRLGYNWRIIWYVTVIVENVDEFRMCRRAMFVEMCARGKAQWTCVTVESHTRVRTTRVHGAHVLLVLLRICER
jgi:hypothetical protein